MDNEKAGQPGEGTQQQDSHATNVRNQSLDTIREQLTEARNAGLTRSDVEPLIEETFKG